jgi:FkbM family methyltransferase
MIKEIGGFKWLVREGTLDEATIKSVIRPVEYQDFIQAKSGDVILDVGMNVGGFAIPAGARGAKIIGYEPHPDSYRIACANISANKIDAITFQKAVSDKTKDSRLYIYDSKIPAFNSTIVRKDRKSISIECVGINEVLAEFKPNKIKMDCEGEEYDIIMAVKDWSNIEKIVMEWHGIHYYVSGGKVLRDENDEHKNAFLDKLRERFDVEIARKIIKCQLK